VSAIPFEVPARGHVDEKPATVTPSWQDVVRASEAGPAPTGGSDRVVVSADSEVRPMPGDIIEHPKFGRMHVERVEGNFEFVSARLRNQRLIRLSLDVLTLTPVGREDGHVLFRAEPGR
jgi:hypothetical protein